MWDNVEFSRVSCRICDKMLNDVNERSCFECNTNLCDYCFDDHVLECINEKD